MITKNKNWKAIGNDLEEKLTEVFGKKMPKLPENFKKIIVKIIPYLMVVLLILWIPVILALIGIIITATPLVLLSGAKGFSYLVSIVCGLIMMGLQIKAIPGLFKRQIKAWRLLFYISLINVIATLLKLNIWGLIVETIISWYFLFQIKNHYK